MAKKQKPKMSYRTCVKGIGLGGNAWKAEPLFERLQRCRIALAIHGMLSDRESHAVGSRIEKAWLKDDAKKSKAET